MRFNALSRVIETALNKNRIPVRVLAGVKFFDRAEVKDILSYLTIIMNPDYIPSLRRSINTPKRGIGPKVSIKLTLIHLNAKRTYSLLKKLRTSPKKLVLHHLQCLKKD